MRYLKCTITYGLNYTRKWDIEAYADSDFGSDEKTRRSTTGYILSIRNTPTSWCSKLQRCVSTSTMESEYYSLSKCSKHCTWYINLLNEMNCNIENITINIDNKATIYNSKNQSINSKTEHIDIRYHYKRELIKDNKIKLRYVKSEHILADGFTKYLNNTLIYKFRNSLLTKQEDLKIY